MIQKTILAMSVVFCGLSANANVAPYYDTNQLCRVNHPAVGNFINAGYFADEACTRVYVLPPIQGEVRVNNVMHSAKNRLCPVIKETFKKIKQVYKSMESDTTPEKIAEAHSTIKELKDSLNELVGNTTTTVITASLNLEWNKLVEAYREANPDKEVLQIPLTLGTFSPAKNFEDVERREPLNSVKVHGLSMNRSDYEGTLASSIKNSIINEGSVMMSNALSAQIELNLYGTCMLEDEVIEKQKSDLTLGYFNYIAPIRTPGNFQVNINESALEQEIIRISGTKRQLSVEDLYSQVKASNSVNVVTAEVNPRYIENLVKLTLQNILASLSDASVLSEQYNGGCAMSLTSINCVRTKYKLKDGTLNWSLVKKQLKEFSEKSDSQKTIYIKGTTQFKL